MEIDVRVKPVYQAHKAHMVDSKPGIETEQNSPFVWSPDQ